MNIKWISALFVLNLPIGLTWANMPTAEIRVVGTLSVPSCSVIAPNNGVYDLGKLPATAVNSTPVSLKPLTQTWRIQCDADTYLQLLTTDNRADTGMSQEPTNYRLTARNGIDALGYYSVEITNVTVNGQPVRTRVQGENDSAYTTHARMRSGQRIGWGQNEDSLHSGRLFTADITVYPVLAAAGGVSHGMLDGEKIDGSMTMGFEFGL